MGSGSPGTRRSEVGQHELRPDLRGIGGNDFGIGKPVIVGGGGGGTLAPYPVQSERRDRGGGEVRIEACERARSNLL